MKGAANDGNVHKDELPFTENDEQEFSSDAADLKSKTPLPLAARMAQQRNLVSSQEQHEESKKEFKSEVAAERATNKTNKTMPLAARMAQQRAIAASREKRPIKYHADTVGSIPNNTSTHKDPDRVKEQNLTITTSQGTKRVAAPAGVAHGQTKRNHNAITAIPAPAVCNVPELKRISTASTVNTVSFDGGTFEKQERAVTTDRNLDKGVLVSAPNKKRRNLIVCLSLCFLVLVIPFVIMASLGVFQKETPTNVGSEGDTDEDDDIVSRSMHTAPTFIM